MHTFRVILGRIAACLFLAALVGCGTSNRGAVTGQMTLDGQPIDGGVISFVPAGGNPGPSAWGKVEAGGYSIPCKTGPAVGTNRVEIRYPRKTGRMLPNLPDVPEVVEAVPVRYNNQSELKVEIKPGDNKVNFDLKSK